VSRFEGELRGQSNRQFGKWEWLKNIIKTLKQTLRLDRKMLSTIYFLSLGPLVPHRTDLGFVAVVPPGQGEKKPHRIG
jgi:hypothetical protein